MSANSAFDQFKKRICNAGCIQHEETCQYRHRPIPINECTCDCYEKAIFMAGYRAAKGIDEKKNG